MRYDSLIDVMAVRPTIQDLFANFYPKILHVAHLDPLEQKENKSGSPKH